MQSRYRLGALSEQSGNTPVLVQVTINGINGDRLRSYRKSTCGVVSNDALDTSEFFLPTPRGLPSNLYGYELRFRQKADEEDEAIVRCPLRRSACAYAGNFLLGCTAALDDT